MAKKYICQKYLEGDSCTFETECGEEEEIIDEAIKHLDDDSVTHSIDEQPYGDQAKRRENIRNTLVDC